MNFQPRITFYSQNGPELLVTIQTEKLFIRSVTAGDYGNLLRCNQTAEKVQKYIGDWKESNACSLFSVFELPMKFVGCVGLVKTSRPGDLNQPKLVGDILKSEWKRGYGEQVTKAMIAYAKMLRAKGDLTGDKIYARVRHDWPAAQDTLRTTGWTYFGEQKDLPDEIVRYHYFFDINKEEEPPTNLNSTGIVVPKVVRVVRFTS